MSKSIATLPLLAVFATTAWAAQEGVKESDVSAASKRYRAYRLQATEPSFGLAKVQALIRKIKPDKEENRRLTAAAFDRLTTPEKFTYCMLHGEDASQNCDAMPWILGEERKVFAYAPFIFDGESTWSERQLAFLKGHRTDSIRLLRETIRTKHRVGVNLKAAIGYYNANELIPDLIRTYERDRRDGDILTVLMLLMKEGKYPPFLASATYRKLYGDGANYQSFIEANPANQKLMFERAMAFYRNRVG